MSAVPIPAEAWLDETRIDRGRASRGRKAARGELSRYDGMVEINVPVDVGALGNSVTVRFPMSALIQLHRDEPQ